MKLRSFHFGFAALAAVLTLVFLLPQAARAFSVDSQSSTNFDGSPKFADPDEAVSNFGRGGPALGSGTGPAVQFGVQRPDLNTSQDWNSTITRPYNPWSNPKRN